MVSPQSTAPAPYRAQAAEAVSAAMEAAGYTQRTLSTATGIPRVTLQRRLAAHSAFTVDELGQIAAVLDVALSDLVTPGVRA